MIMHLIQLKHALHGRRVGIVTEPEIILLHEEIQSVYQLFTTIINEDKSADTFIRSQRSVLVVRYDDIYNGRSGWKILPPADCPEDGMKCLLSGTGLTHKASADNRQKMHERQHSDQLTDSMKMYLLGEQGGKPEAGSIGVQPEWFYKGNGLALNAHGDELVVPAYADDGGEEPEIAGVYLISNKGIPYRLGFVQANEFSDHVMERKNYLYLAPSKLRNCSIGPELVIGMDFHSLKGMVQIYRDKKIHWSKDIYTGEEAMAHSLLNLEHHHFKYPQHRVPGQIHIHFFGAGAFSFGENIQLQDGDEMVVHFPTMGRPLVNRLKIDPRERQMVKVKPVL